MLKKLDILLLRAFIGPFVATFLIATFVLVMQFFWLWVDDFIGKGIDLFTILQVIGYVGATTVPLALPIAILLSSIMTFGNLGESYELVAIRSAGIPLLRFMRPMFFSSVVIGGLAFLFANNIIPVVTLRLETMKYNIVYSKPTLDIKAGIFYDKIPGFVMKVGRKDKDGPGIYDVMIYEKAQGVQDNLIAAESGLMQMSADKKNLDVILKNGTRYEEKGIRTTLETELTRLSFDEYKKTFDLSSFGALKIADSSFKDHYKMLTERQLTRSIDSLQKIKNNLISKISKEALNNFTFIEYIDSGWINNNALDTAKPQKNMLALIPDSARNDVMNIALSQANAAKGTMDVYYNDYLEREKEIRFHNIEWHRKFSLSVACLVLFFIGAPLGSIIRKGGIGAPLVFAIIFFVLFYLISTFGEKFVKQGALPPVVGMWLATIVLTPIGFFLTYKAMRDSQILNKEYYFRIIKKWGYHLKKRQK